MPLDLTHEKLQERLGSGKCLGCGSSDYTQVCYRGKPKYGPNGLYCESCWDGADRDIFGENESDRLTYGH